MSIDAQIRDVILEKDGSGTLMLIDRPGKIPGIAGQNILRFINAPPNIKDLKGRNIWGGAASIMLGYVEIASRKGYTTIKLVDELTLKRAIEEDTK